MHSDSNFFIFQEKKYNYLFSGEMAGNETEVIIYS